MQRRVKMALAVPLAAGFPCAAQLNFAPTDIQQPGTQPGEIVALEAPTKCDNCHGGYDLAVEPAHNWRGSMMAHASRDPIFWATVAVAESDLGGAGTTRRGTSARWRGPDPKKSQVIFRKSHFGPYHSCKQPSGER